MSHSSYKITLHTYLHYANTTEGEFLFVLLQMFFVKKNTKLEIGNTLPYFLLLLFIMFSQCCYTALKLGHRHCLALNRHN